MRNAPAQNSHWILGIINSNNLNTKWQWHFRCYINQPLIHRLQLFIFVTCNHWISTSLITDFVNLVWAMVRYTVLITDKEFLKDSISQLPHDRFLVTVIFQIIALQKWPIGALEIRDISQRLDNAKSPWLPAVQSCATCLRLGSDSFQEASIKGVTLQR